MKVGIVSPSGSLNEDGTQRVNMSLDYLRNLGLEPVMGKHVFEQHRYMAGSAEARAEDIMRFFKDPEIKMIFCTRGGAGAQFVLPYLNYEIIKKNPKPIFGFSDGTCLQLGVWAKTKNPAYTGFCLSFNFKDGDIDPVTDASFKAILQGKKFVANGGDCLKSGKAEGILVGGCLSLLRALCGTPYYPNLGGAILLIEDVGEVTYKIDLMLEQIKQSPNFDKIKGIVFGKFVGCEEKDVGDGSIDAVIDEFSSKLNVPIIKNFPYAHEKKRYVLPIGKKVRMNADLGTVEF